MKLCIVICGAQRMNPDDFGDPLTFHLVPPAGQSCHSCCNMPEHQQDGLAQRQLLDGLPGSGAVFVKFDGPLTFHPTA